MHYCQQKVCAINVTINDLNKIINNNEALINDDLIEIYSRHNILSDYAYYKARELRSESIEGDYITLSNDIDYKKTISRIYLSHIEAQNLIQITLMHLNHLKKIVNEGLGTPSLSIYYSKTSSIEKTINYIKIEFKKGEQSHVNTSENEINTLGYKIMEDGKTEEALKIFKLNTELYPSNWNTFDSYGECLLKLNRKDEGIMAYKKSLVLNPNNENAKNILEIKK